MPPAIGLYDRLMTEGLLAALTALVDRTVATGPLGRSEAPRALGRHLGDLVTRALDTVPDDARPAAQVEIVNRLVDTLAQALGEFAGDDDRVRGEVLHSITALGHAPPERPELALSESGLYVNARRERRLGAALQKEVVSADRIDLICAFLTWDGYRELRPRLEAHRAAGRDLRLLTTTYRGVTEARVLEDLLALGAGVRISYRSDATRLHAKAWLFHRESGYSTAYIGSSNLSRTALGAGLEWNVRLSEIENRGVLDEFRGAFESYWSDPEFEPYEAERFARETKGERPDITLHAVFELRPKPFQQQILDVLAAERELHDRHRNLVAAATGTGKTVMAALDYRRLCDEAGRRLTLLFVAHRREILRQSIDTFRHAMSDPNFGERWVDGQRPVDEGHVFASVQSLAQVDVEAWAPGRYDVVIVDEFHHAAGETYQRLLRHLAPRELVGLTATPERADGVDILHWFEDRIAAEVRLWDAIDRGLLVPFHYFAIHDLVSLEHVRWVGGRLDQAELDNLYTGHHARAHLVVEAIRSHIGNPATMRALAFCAGVGHARFMAAAFEEAGLPSVAIVGTTPKHERDQAIAALRNGTIRCLCTVDVFNEGVDIPEIDTVLFLRPTESAVVFQQQLGRGLRRASNKRCLTVLDFVAVTDRRFRYDVRYRALLGVGRNALRKEIEEGFPYLPSGCSIQLDRVSKEVILENVSRGIGADRRSLVQELKALGDVDLGTFLRETGLELEELYRGGRYFTELRRAASLPCPPAGPNETDAGSAFGRLLHVDDRLRLDAWRGLRLPEDLRTERLQAMLATLLFGLEAHDLGALRAEPALCAELDLLLSLLDARIDHTVVRWGGEAPLAIHARYRLTEIMEALGDIRAGRLYVPREGEYFHEPSRTNLLFVTLQKDEEDYSPTTMYRDYALGPTRFHWQSQSGTRPTDKKERRHIEHAAQQVTPLLFVRERRKDERNETMPYVFLGPIHIAGWTGERPMNVEWQLEHACRRRCGGWRRLSRSARWSNPASYNDHRKTGEAPDRSSK